MTDGFDRLSPALQYQIVNGLGWKGLRPVQERAVHTILDGHNCVILAPTAGGKTEAAFFPLLSMLDQEDLRPTSVLYIAPIRALLNNQEPRLERLAGMLGRRATKWHGDVGASARRRFIREPADILAITPESVEAMLMSTRTPGKELLSRVRAVVIDEVHAFASDDRGAHLVALLERIARLSAYDIQRIGLSATVGDPETICDWLSGSSARPRTVVDPGGDPKPEQLALDFVGSLENAALLIDKLHPNTRRLVFVDSRRRVEQLGDLLQRRQTNVYVSHSSLAVSERQAAERAFEEGHNCVIVATSALELGIDVGDLDHVLQLDAPSTVSSFLQRMGRTGRRPNTVANCTFLATSDDAVLQAAALLRLHSAGYVEPTEPTRWAPHILAHQLLALALQQNGVAQADWWDWLDGCAAFTELDRTTRQSVCDHMLSEQILVEADSRLILGPRGERLYGARNFFELFAVFSVPPVLKVMYGRQEIGTIDAWFAQQRTEGPLCFVLANRRWRLTTVNWKRATCQVEPAERGAPPRWMGQPKLLSQALCRSMHAVLTDEGVDPAWSRRAAAVMERLREEHAFLHDEPTPVVAEPGGLRWWTHGGGRANALLALLLEVELGERVRANNVSVVFSDGAGKSEVGVRRAIAALGKEGAVSWEVAEGLVPEKGLGRLSKFGACLPEGVVRGLGVRGVLDVGGGRTVVSAPA